MVSQVAEQKEPCKFWEKLLNILPAGDLQEAGSQFYHCYFCLSQRERAKDRLGRILKIKPVFRLYVTSFILQTRIKNGNKLL